jgi:hypothetical protein
MTPCCPGGYISMIVAATGENPIFLRPASINTMSTLSAINHRFYNKSFLTKYGLQLRFSSALFLEKLPPANAAGSSGIQVNLSWPRMIRIGFPKTISRGIFSSRSLAWIVPSKIIPWQREIVIIPAHALWFH